MPTDIQVVSSTRSRATTGVGGVITTPSHPPLIKTQPIQVVGLVPLHDCTATECRKLPDLACCDRLLVFGGDGTEINSNALPGYTVDYNTFMIDLAIYGPNASSTIVSIILQKCTGRDTWTNSATLTGSNTYGTYIALGTYTGHPTYCGYTINWARVLALKGPGIYRIKFTTSMRTLVGCLISDEFDVKKFDCNRAHGTVKFEAFLKGKIGDINKQGHVFDLCGVGTPIAGRIQDGLYDSIRIPGFFGYEKIKEYLEVILEYQTGLQERVKDEAIQSFSFMSGYFKKELHDRIKIYALMSDKLLVSDYNINNSDYNINRLQIIKAGPYEPVYQDKNRRRISKVTVEFKAGIQQIIKSLCCPTK